MSPCHPAGILAVGSRSPCAHGQALSPHPREGPVPRAGSPGRPSAPRPAGAARSSAAPQGAWREAGTAALRTGLERGTGQGPGPGKAAEGQQAGSPQGLRGQHPLACGDLSALAQPMQGNRAKTHRVALCPLLPAVQVSLLLQSVAATAAMSFHFVSSLSRP